PLVVVVMDAGGNPVEGTQVTFEVVEGGGTVDGQNSVIVPTDSDGRASVTFHLGAKGLDANRVVATFPGLSEDAAMFVASGFLVDDTSVTLVSGVVLDGQSEPVPGVTVSIHGTDLETTTDEYGRFHLVGAPVARIHLEVDGSTATRPGAW